jgi:hypothetical protein
MAVHNFISVPIIDEFKSNLHGSSSFIAIAITINIPLYTTNADQHHHHHQYLVPLYIAYKNIIIVPPTPNLTTPTLLLLLLLTLKVFDGKSYHQQYIPTCICVMDQIEFCIRSD